MEETKLQKIAEAIPTPVNLQLEAFGQTYSWLLRHRQ